MYQVKYKPPLAGGFYFSSIFEHGFESRFGRQDGAQELAPSTVAVVRLPSGCTKHKHDIIHSLNRVDFLMKKIYQKGFSVLEVALVVVILGLLGGGGWYIYQRNQDTNKTAASTPKADTATPIADEMKTLEIKEWGVKLKSKYADKLTYKYSDTDGELTKGDMLPYVSSIEILFKPGVMDDEECQPGFGFQRLTNKNDSSAYVTIGDYTYASDGAPGPCSNDANSHDDTLKGEVIREVDLANLETM